MLRASLKVERTGNTLFYRYFLENATNRPFVAAHACLLDLWLVNAAGQEVRHSPSPDAACQARYVTIRVAPHARAAVLRNRLEWNLAELPAGTYGVKSRWQLFHVADGFPKTPFVVWSAPFSLPGGHR
ncbi:hypothetical protein DEIPH_ctg002orf0083 [Deinococcus phoenicis]|uniref:Intracellular proteinase inhibitor BsuPI domain-containing protein n=1 Tax=Deinococcus phoenicis TaxID=1476583 RepID=A0A016QVC5_9DEIO|nr:hypothetical protein [Deinococcus phoenicis]EYB69754.1 hypothetical protein DEIPH_ctg002orf0083 [Deinococcus phoenicis]